MRDPKVLSRLPRQEEVPPGGNGEIGSVRIALFVDDASREVRGAADARGGDAVQGGVDGFLHLRFPIPSRVAGGVDGAGTGDHFGAVGSRGQHAGGLAGQLGREGDAFPVLAPVLGVQQQRGLAEHPPLAVFETDHLEAVRDFLLGVEVGEGARLPRVSPVVRFGERSARAHDVPVGGGIEVDGEDRVLEGDGDAFPLLRGGGRGGSGQLCECGGRDGGGGY